MRRGREQDWFGIHVPTSGPVNLSSMCKLIWTKISASSQRAVFSPTDKKEQERRGENEKF